MKRMQPILAGLALALLLAACASDNPALSPPTNNESGNEPGAGVAFGTPADGEAVTSPVPVAMEAENFTIEPAGEVVDGAGHFHIMVDTVCVEPGQVIPKDDAHLHFGEGQTETELELAPGEHTLCLQAGDGAHTALDLTDTITIEVTG